ncbi:MAG: hypothetical protein J6B75_04695, partial [Ruminococcus sp.]|nr:hypothetical protein [Ruminococcus sp.]
SAAVFHRFISQPASGRSSALPCLTAFLVLSEFWCLLHLHSLFFSPRILKLKVADILILDEPLNHLSFENSRKFNDIIIEEIKHKPTLAIIMVSHCRAANFTDKALVYDKTSKSLKVSNYTSYDCFADDFCISVCE